MKSLRGYVFILGATMFWGVSATIAKSLFTQQVDTLVLVQTRMTLSCILLVIFFSIYKREIFRVRKKDLYRFALLGIIGNAGSNFMYYFTIKETNVATAILLQYLAPLLVLLYAAVTREERLSFTKILAGIVSLAGCFLAVAGKDFSLLSISTIGLACGLTAAFCWAFTNVILRHILKDYEVWTTLIYSFISASVFWLFFSPPWVLMGHGYSAATWGTFLGFALISILIPHSLYFTGIQYLTASRAIITATFEPIVAIVSAYFVLSEVLTPIQIVGAVLVIAAIAILQLKQEVGQDLHREHSTP